jgi:hypothetical protein
MSGACGSLQIPGVLGQHPLGHLLLPTPFFIEITTYHDTGPGAPPSTSSSTSMVATAGLRPAPSGGPTSTYSLTSVVHLLYLANNVYFSSFEEVLGQSIDTHKKLAFHPCIYTCRSGHARLAQLGLMLGLGHLNRATARPD